MAWNLRRLRVQCGLSQEALAVDTGIDRTFVSRIERGLENPTVAVLERIATAVNADVVDLVTKPAKGEAKPVSLPGGRKPKQ